MKLAYLDDSREDRSLLVPLVEQTFKKANIRVRQFDVFTTPEDLLKDFKKHSYDVLLLDIFMPGTTGLEVAEKIRQIDEHVKIIFCSTSNDFASESYNVNASYYIHKPVTEQTILNMINCMRVADNLRNSHITLPDGQRFILRNLVSARYKNHRIDILFKNGMELHTWLPFHNLMDLLSTYTYIAQINSGTLINLHEVRELEKATFYMNNGDSYLISRRRKSEIITYYHNWLLHDSMEAMTA